MLIGGLLTLSGTAIMAVGAALPRPRTGMDGGMIPEPLHEALLGMTLPLQLAMALMLGSLGRVLLFLLGARMLSRGLALAVRCRTTVLLLRGLRLIV